MLPNQQMPPMPMGEAGKTAGAGGQPVQPSPEISPAQAREAIMTVLARLKSIADRYGIDLQELVADMSGGGEAVAPPPPPA